MAFRWTNTLKDKDATGQSVFLNRRQIMAGAAGLGLVGLAGALRLKSLSPTRLRTSAIIATIMSSGQARKTLRNMLTR